MSTQIGQILESFPQVLTLVRGSQQTVVDGLQTAELAQPQQMIFVGNAEHFRAAVNARSRIWLTTPELEKRVPDHVTDVLVSPQVALCMAEIARRFFPLTEHHRIIAGAKIHPSAQIATTARLGENCIVGPGAVIGEYCELAADCIIGANSVIEPRVTIGARTHIHPLVFIGHSCVIGADCVIKPHSTIGTEGYGYAQDKQFNHYRITHYGRVVIEDKVDIGAGVQIDRGTFLDSHIGSGTKIDNHCHLGHNFRVGKNTLITGGFMAAGSVSVGSYCVIGGRSSAKGHLTIGDRVHLGALSAVGKDITKPGEYAGYPLQPIKEDMRTRAAMKNLVRLTKQVQRVLKHLGLPADETSTES